MSEISATRVINALRLRLFWMTYGVFFIRSSGLDLTRLKVGGQEIRLAIPPGEAKAMQYEMNNILYNDCYGLRRMGGGINRILDVGANVGLFSLAARSQFPKAKIHCYEPNPQVQMYLLHNTAPLSLEVFQEAIGKEEGWIDMQSDTVSLFAKAVPSANGKIKKTAMMRALERLGGTVDLLKLDCEGAEWELLEKKEIWKRVQRVTMEYHLWANPSMEVPEMVRLFKQNGFKITHLCEDPQWGILQAERQ